MSHKTVICFAIWTSFWSALFNHFYTVYFGSFGVPWIMFVCMAIYFGMGGAPKQVPGMILSAFCGLAWGQFDFILINFFGSTCHMSAEMASFVAILVGTAITMYIHIKLLGATPLGFMPFIFAGVCLTFSQGGSNVAGLAFTLFVGIVLAVLHSMSNGYSAPRNLIPLRSQNNFLYKRKAPQTTLCALKVKISPMICIASSRSLHK